MRLRAAFPPTGVVVVLRDLDEAELLVVVRADPFGGIDRPLLERGKYIAGSKLLRHDAEFPEDAAGKTTDAEFQPLHVIEVLDFPTEPAPHLARRIARRHAPAVVRLEEIVEQLHAAAMELPGLLLTRVEPKGQGSAEGERGVLAEVIIARGVPHLDGAVLHRIEHLQARHDFACSEHLDVKLVIAEFSNALGHVVSRAIERVERLRPARRKPPSQLGY